MRTSRWRRLSAERQGSTRLMADRSMALADKTRWPWLQFAAALRSTRDQWEAVSNGGAARSERWATAAYRQDQSTTFGPNRRVANSSRSSIGTREGPLPQTKLRTRPSTNVKLVGASVVRSEVRHGLLWVGSTCSGLVELPTYGPRRCRQALPALERPLRRMSTFERPSTYGGCTFEPVVGVAKSWPIVGLQVAVTVSSRARQEADFRCTSQGWPRSSVGEVRELALPAISGLS